MSARVSRIGTSIATVAQLVVGDRHPGLDEAQTIACHLTLSCCPIRRRRIPGSDHQPARRVHRPFTELKSGSVAECVRRFGDLLVRGCEGATNSTSLGEVTEGIRAYLESS
jgi:hypothetical protein